MGIQDDGQIDVGKYTLLRKLGQGSLGTTYLAVHLGQPRKFALRILHRHLWQDASAITLMLHEARTASRMNHPNVVRTVAVEQPANGVPYIVTEYVDGPTLEMIGAATDLSVGRVRCWCSLLASVLAGLGHAHGFGIVHGALTGADIRVTPEGQPKLLGLDASLIRESLDDTFTPDMERQLRYRAPELMRVGSHPSKASDVFSVAVCAWEGLAGKTMDHGSTVAILMQDRMQGRSPSLREAAPEVPDEVCDAIAAAMSFEPQRRPTAQAFEAMLRSAAVGTTADDIARWLERLFPASATSGPNDGFGNPIAAGGVVVTPGPSSSGAAERDWIPAAPIPLEEQDALPAGHALFTTSRIRTSPWPPGPVAVAVAALALLAGAGSIAVAVTAAWTVTGSPSPRVSVLEEARSALSDDRPELALELLRRVPGSDPSVLAEAARLEVEANQRLELARARVDLLHGRIDSATARIRLVLRDAPQDPLAQGMLAEVESLAP